MESHLELFELLLRFGIFIKRKAEFLALSRMPAAVKGGSRQHRRIQG
ncbi:MAG: hypothetical protein LIP23_00435 [Planctomycetes bacterium]|nr:hypothetical protein [Planctomycetota bacterium]